MDKNMEKRVAGIKECPIMNRFSDSVRATFKKVPNLKTLGHYGIHGYWLKKILPSTTDWL